MTATGSRLSLIRRSRDSLELQHCQLINLSYGGMCFRTGLVFEEREEYHFLIEVRGLPQDLALVKARIQWVDSSDPLHRLVGAEFLESSEGWLGPDIDDYVH